MDIEKIKDTPIADFLSRLGYHSVKGRGGVLWYHSPYRNDKSPSFKLDTRKEKWFDFGMGEGGDIFTLAGKLIPSNDFIRQAQYIAETMKLPMPEIKGTEYQKNLPDEEPQFANVEVLPLGHYALRQYQGRYPLRWLPGTARRYTTTCAVSVTLPSAFLMTRAVMRCATSFSRAALHRRGRRLYDAVNSQAGSATCLRDSLISFQRWHSVVRKGWTTLYSIPSSTFGNRRTC